MYFTSLTISVLLATIANAAVAPAGKPVQIQATGSSRASCIYASSPSNRTTLFLDECTTTPIARAFTVVKGGASTGSGTPGQIKVYTKFCLDVIDGVDKDGTLVQIYQCSDNNKNQKWQFNADGSIQWAGHSKCLDVKNGNFVDGVLQIWTCSKGNKNQKWSAAPVAPVPSAPKGKPIQFQNGLDANAKFSSNGPCLQVRIPVDESGKGTNGIPVETNTCHSITTYHSWTVVNGGSNTGTGPVGPIQVLDGFCLDVVGGVNADGTRVQIWKCAPGNKNQQWTVNSDFSIRWANTNKCLDLPGGTPNDFVGIQVWTCGKNNRNQQWIPNKVDTLVLE